MTQSVILPIAAVLLVLSLALGGGARNGLLSDMPVQIFAAFALLFLLAPGFQRLKSSPFHVLMFCFVVLLPLLQLVPLPASIWMALPGRDAVIDLYRDLAIELSSRPLTLRPSETWRAFISLLPAVAIGLAVAVLDLRSRMILILIVIGFAMLNVFIALGQIIGGQNSALYFYDITNRGRAVGLFANANHYTAFLYAVVPFVAALFSGSSGRSAPIRNAVLGVSFFILIVGLSISGSRTAVLLGGVSLFLSVLFVAWKTIGPILSQGLMRIVGAILFILLVPVLLGIGLYQIFTRFQTQDPLEDLRFEIVSALLTFMHKFLPFGSGFGTFEQIYQNHEPLETVTPFYIHQAHNDFLQLIIEGGIFSGAAIVAFLIGLAYLTLRTFMQTGFIELRLEKAAIISLWLVTIHSAWDYPLRTIIVSSLFAISLAILVKPAIINAETINDVLQYFERLKSYDWLSSKMGRRRRKRHRSQKPKLPVLDDTV